MALHSAFALKEGVSKDTVEALRAGRSPHEPRLRALSEFSRAMVRHRGHLAADDLQKFLGAGYSKAQALEVVLGVAVSILPNFAHHITQCPIDEPFRGHAWTTADAESSSPLTA
jgi:alkylhydroperoxidase family enzyme